MEVLQRISNFILKVANECNDCYNVLICGDLNSRIGNEKDYVVFDTTANIDVLPPDYEVDENIARSSQDKVINTNGRKLLEFCKLNGLRVCNGRLGDDNGVGKYTYVGSTGCSVIDYVIVNPSLFDMICSFQVGDPNILSDHCVVEFSLLSRSAKERATAQENVKYEKVHKKYEWAEDLAGQYINGLEEESGAFEQLSLHVNQITSTEQIDENLQMFTELMSKVCDPLFSKTLTLRPDHPII
ncbi:MAG: hypothetical protein JAY66_20205 [Candidatus Thiodiazotropha taylori]|nr:hypothetical protein [Candidatus Thiodiazotropha taylori]